MNRVLLLLLVASNAAAFAPVNIVSKAPRALVSSSRQYSSTLDETEFDVLVNKNKDGAKQDIEERSERISLDLSK
eukprot:CAMPEP_0197433632 /NCGR_PEP_ID=MMETSP1175-20131217/1495_1 /TAXON_ID=1003142 /ORGANISM="Triceratium dubium, Strain CCMP147" /LENGTH=74 /DNA_ID=CAMNT_0042962085 /DNA_START=47 /DNA_END=268 /DNA_ORIENTATION=-